MEGVERIPEVLPAAVWRQVAAEVAAAFGVHHEATVANTTELLRVMRQQPQVLAEERGPDTVTPWWPDWMSQNGH